MTAPRRCARRGAAEPAELPPRVGVIVDASGSVSDVDLGSALLEVAATTRAVGGRRDLVTVLSCDAAARIVHPPCQIEDDPLVGGGSTDLRTGVHVRGRWRSIHLRPEGRAVPASWASVTRCSATNHAVTVFRPVTTRRSSGSDPSRTPL